MEKPENLPETEATPETAKRTDPEIQAIIEQTAEAMSLPPGLVDGLIDEAKFRRAFPCETLYGRDPRNG